MKILLVDDDQVDRALIARALHKSELNAVIAEAATVDEGLMLFRKMDFDMVLLDYRMPQRDGIEMIVELRNEPKGTSTAILMMSSSEDERLAMECIKSGAQDFLLKSEISAIRLRRALLNAKTRFEVEQQLYQTYQKVKSLAHTDVLTSQSNRYFFDESLKLAIANNRRRRCRLVLLLLDIDDFCDVNQKFAHRVGDDWLKKEVIRITNSCSNSEFFTRLDGNEFAILLNDVESIGMVSSVALQLLNLFRQPFEVDGTLIELTASIGIALYPDNANSSEALFRSADVAMCRAKKMGKNQLCFFTDDMQMLFAKRVAIEDELDQAIKRQHFALLFQPLLNATNGSLIGFEALLRCTLHDEVKLPCEFLTIAEETNQIVEIGAWVIEKAVATLSMWNSIANKRLIMAINLSVKQLVDENIVAYFKKLLSQYDVDPKLIEIELREAVFLKQSEQIRNAIVGLSQLGCNFSLDAFGTGFFSISSILNYPVQVIKIDRELISDIDQNVKSKALLKGLVSMASMLGLKVVAVGVEHESQLRVCSQLGLDRVQGFFCEPPLTAEEISLNYLSVVEH